MNFLGFNPFQGFLCPTGFHNIIPEVLRPYIPTHKYSILPIFTPLSIQPYNINFSLGIKAPPDQIFNSERNKIYKIITTGKNINNLFDIAFDYTKEIFDGMSAIHLASHLNNFEVVHFLINKEKIDINMKSPLGKTALHYAAENNNDLMVKYLLNNGADVYETDMYGFDILDKCEFRGLYSLKSNIEKMIEKNLIIKNKTKSNMNYYIESPQVNTKDRQLPSSLVMKHTYAIGNNDVNRNKSFSVYFLKDFYIY